MAYEEVDVRRPVRMPVKSLQDLARWPVKGNGVRHRPETVEIVLSVLASGESSSQVHVWLVWILLLVQSVGCCVPDIDDCTLHRLACLEVCNCAVHPCAVAILLDAMHNAASHFHLGGILSVEGAKNCSGSGLISCVCRKLVCDFVHKGFQSKNVAQKLAFIALGVGHAAGFVHLSL